MREPRTTASVALRSLTRSAQRGKLCLVLGAGASADLGVPLWKDLVHGIASDSGLYSDLDAEQRRQLDEHLAGDLPLAFDLLRRRDVSLDVQLRKRLYSTKKRDVSGKVIVDNDGESLLEPLARNWTKVGAGRLAFEETTLASLAQLAIWSALCGPRRAYHVLTYNADTLLEEAIAAYGFRACAVNHKSESQTWLPARSAPDRPDVAPGFPRRSKAIELAWEAIGGSSSRAADLEVRVLHVHGSVPRASRRRLIVPRVDPGARVNEDLVFSAEQYERRYAHPIRPFNAAQVAVFGADTCLFYGFSFSDAAVRTLARAAARAPGRVGRRHYALLNRAEFPPVRSVALRWVEQLAKLNVLTLATAGFSAHLRFVRTLLLSIAAEQQRGPARAAS